MHPTVFIPNYNGAARIHLALDGLRGQTREAAVVVVDNGSDDDSPQLIRERYPEVELIEVGSNLGFGPALNRAIAATATADPVILLNDDAAPAPDFVAALLDRLDDGLASVAGVMTQADAPDLIDSAGVVADATLMGFDYLHDEPVAILDRSADPLGPTGGAALYRRQAFDRVGGFDERMFIYYEDLDLALRLAAAGGNCGLAGDARASHAYGICGCHAFL